MATPARRPPQSGTVPGTTAQRDARGRAPPQVQARWRARRLGGGSPGPALAPRRGRQHDVPVRSVALKLWNPCGAAGSGPSWLTAGGGALGATGERSVRTDVSVFQSPGPCAPKNGCILLSVNYTPVEMTFGKRVTRGRQLRAGRQPGTAGVSIRVRGSPPLPVSASSAGAQGLPPAEWSRARVRTTSTRLPSPSRHSGAVILIGHSPPGAWLLGRPLPQTVGQSPSVGRARCLPASVQPARWTLSEGVAPQRFRT